MTPHLFITYSLPNFKHATAGDTKGVLVSNINSLYPSSSSIFLLSNHHLLASHEKVLFLAGKTSYKIPHLS